MSSFKANYMPGAEKYWMVDQNGEILIDEHGKETDKGSVTRASGRRSTEER